jgi:hypothetical protein
MLSERFRKTRAARRRYVAGYYLCVILLGVFWGRALYGNSSLVAVLIPVLYVVSIAMGGVKAGGPIRPFSKFYDTSAHTPDSSVTGRRRSFRSVDERDTLVRDHAHYAAYSTMRVLGLLCTLAVVAVFVVDRHWLLPLMAFLLYPAYALLMSLPQAILLWTEPDPAPESPANLAGAAR